MQFHNVCLEAFGYTLPEEIVTSEDIEAALGPLYTRLRLPEGRLELMTGIRERRFWKPGVLPSEKSVESAERAIRAAGIPKEQIGALVHASVCRDFLEPATACGVHHRLGLGSECQVFDLSNACLGLLNGMVQVAGMIELGQIRAGVVVGTEVARPLVEATIEKLNTDDSLTREDVKLAVASLTIGSASVAVVLVDAELSRTQNRLLSATARAYTDHHGLCHSGRDEAAAAGMSPLMRTDSEALLRRGIEAGGDCFADFLKTADWSANDIDKIIGHQVGRAHRKLLLETLGLDEARDFSTLETLGNTGSAALPVTAAIAAEQGHLRPGDRTALLGIGSGINVLMLAVNWQRSLVEGSGFAHSPTTRMQQVGA